MVDGVGEGVHGDRFLFANQDETPAAMLLQIGRDRAEPALMVARKLAAAGAQSRRQGTREGSIALGGNASR